MKETFKIFIDGNFIDIIRTFKNRKFPESISEVFSNLTTTTFMCMALYAQINFRGSPNKSPPSNQ